MEPAIYSAIERLAKKDGVSLSQKTRDMILMALEITEDAALDAVVAERRRNRRPSITHRELKRRLGIK